MKKLTNYQIYRLKKLIHNYIPNGPKDKMLKQILNITQNNIDFNHNCAMCGKKIEYYGLCKDCFDSLDIKNKYKNIGGVN